MGSCGSSSRVEKPLQISNPVSTPKQDDETEEIKTPDKYCKPSVEFYEEFANKQNDTEFIKTKDMSQRPSRSQSAFNLQRDLIESLKNEERIRRFENPSSEWREKNDATSYKITEEQHTAIYIFVEEKNRIIYEEIFKLYTHLIRNIQEHEDLPLFIEYLRGHNKDVENCIEDLQAHPIDNEKYFYRTVEKNRKLIKLLVSEYNTYRKNIKNYRGFREVILSCIKQYNLSQQDTGVSDETPELQPFKEKSQIVLIQNDDLGDAFNKFTKYLDQLKEDKIMLIKMWEILKIESVNKTKESDRKISETKIQIFQKVKSIKPKYQDLDNQIDTALSNFEGGFEEYFVSSNEDIIKLKQLGREVKDQKEALVNFERILMEEKGYQSISKITLQEKIYETSEKGSATLKKFDNNRMFLDGKPTSSAKIQMRKGDNTDIELEFPNENEESPNLTHKLRSLNSGEAYRVKHKPIVV